MYAVLYTDVNMVAFITVELNEPLNGERATAYFKKREDAENYASDAYEVLASMTDDWKSISLRVIKLPDSSATLNASGNNLY